MSKNLNLVHFKLAEMDDVQTSGITAGQTLIWNGQAFAPGNPSPSGKTIVSITFVRSICITCSQYDVYSMHFSDATSLDVLVPNNGWSYCCQ